MTEHKNIIIAIDGYSACGKSTTAKQVATAIGYIYIDTGAMYRAVTLYMIKNHITITNPKDVDRALSQIELEFRNNDQKKDSDIYLNGRNVSSEIRTMAINDMVSPVSALSPVRKKLVELQQKMGRKKGVVMDGRDIGTVVFPDAELKVFMTASLDVRAQRRQQELLKKGETPSIDEVKENLKKRDEIDTSRMDSPLKKAEDAFELDTSNLKISDQVSQVISVFENVIAGRSYSS